MLFAVPVRQVYLSVKDGPSTTADDVEPTAVEQDGSPSTPGRLRFVDGVARYVRCVAVGGYPPPALHVYINDRDLTSSTRLVARTRMDGRPGLRLLATRTERRAGSSGGGGGGGGGLVLSVDDDGSRLRCVATVPGLAANITETVIDVHCKSLSPHSTTPTPTSSRGSLRGSRAYRT